MKKIQYPEQTGYYVVKVKAEQSTHNWQEFDMARLQISVGQEYHENEKLTAAFNWCKHRFSRVQICVNDTLQRFNMMFEYGITEEDARIKAARAGEEWTKRYIHLFSSIPHLEIKKWSSWKLDRRYQEYSKQIEDLYLSNPEFKESIDNNIESIWQRRQASYPGKYNKNRKKEFVLLSKKYLLEEITVFSIMFESDEAIDIYPGTTIFAATIFQNREVTSAPRGLGAGKFCRIDFSKNKRFPYLQIVSSELKIK